MNNECSTTQVNTVYTGDDTIEARTATLAIVANVVLGFGRGIVSGLVSMIVSMISCD